MLRKTFEGVLLSGAALGALQTGALAAEAGHRSVEQVWAAASEVQVYGTAPVNRMPGQAPPVQLLNDPDSGGEVWFLIDGAEKSLKPGETLDLENDRAHTVHFNSGGQAGDIEFSLYQGLYKFKVVPQGWALFKSSSPTMASGGTASVSGSSQGTQQLPPGVAHPPLPATDLRTRRVARGGQSSGGVRAGDPPLKPADTSNSGRLETGTLAAPPPPGINRSRTKPTPAP